MRERQPRLLVIWGKHDVSFELSEPEAYRREVPNVQVHVLDAGHFALDTAADRMPSWSRSFWERSAESISDVVCRCMSCACSPARQSSARAHS